MPDLPAPSTLTLGVDTLFITTITKNKTDDSKSLSSKTMTRAVESPMIDPLEDPIELRTLLGNAIDHPMQIFTPVEYRVPLDLNKISFCHRYATCAIQG